MASVFDLFRMFGHKTKITRFSRMEAAKSDVFQIEEIIMARGRLKRKI